MTTLGGILVLHDNTAYNAAASVLNGRALATQSYTAVWCWFTPAGSYDGTINFELSPDGGVTWFATEAFAIQARATKFTTLASPGATISYVISPPAGAHIRLRMSGGTQGALTAKCILSYLGNA